MAYLVYITSDGDTWDQIAYRYYGDANKYPIIIAANTTVPITGVLPSGLKLAIPVLNEAPTNEGLPPWM